MSKKLNGEDDFELCKTVKVAFKSSHIYFVISIHQELLQCLSMYYIVVTDVGYIILVSEEYNTEYIHKCR